MPSPSRTNSRLRFLSLPIFTLALLILLVGCGGGGGNITPATTVSVVVFPGTATVPVGGQVIFSATVYNATNNAVTWSATGGTFTGSTFTAPATAGNVTVTATSQADTTKIATVTVTVTATQTVSITPAAVVLPSGGAQQFTAAGGGQPVTWSLPAPLPGVNFGSIDQSGNYTAPPTPPPGGSVSVTATTAGGAAVANVTIVFSNASLLGQYAFAYSGEDTGGFLAVAGSMSFDGLGNVLSGGVEDVNSASAVVTNAINGGTYQVGPDGRTIVTFTTSQATVTFQVTVVSPQHGVLVRFDTVATGSGTIDLQNLTQLSVGSISGFYSFGVSGIDSGGFSSTLAGNFLANSNGNFPINNGILDVNDAGTITQADISLQGQITTFDNNTGRGQLQFTSTTIGTLQFAFYIVDHTHFKLVEIDPAPVLAGDAFSAPNFATVGSLSGNNAFTLGGTVTQGAYAAGGVFTTDGLGTVSGGVQDLNVAGRFQPQTIATSGSTYSVSPANSNRILLNISNGSTTFTYGVYPNTNGTAVMIELDTNEVVASGLAYHQSSTAAPQGNYALNLTGTVGQGEEDVNGAIASSGASSVSGYLDVNLTGSLFNNLLLSGSTLSAPTALGRGTLVLQTAGPTSTSFALAYYAVDPQTCLILEIDSQRVMLGIVPKQF
jgi:hypothetical protein